MEHDINRIRKMQNDGRISPSKKLKIVERYSTFNPTSSDPAHNAKMSYNRRINYLETEIRERKEELEGLRTSNLDCRADTNKLELNNCELEDDVNELNREVQLSNESIQNLRELGEESLQSIKNVFELKKKEMVLQHNEKLMKMKESTSDEIKAAFDAAREKLIKRNSELGEEISDLTGTIQFHITEMNRNLIKLKEDHHKKLLLLCSNMNDMLTELEHDSYLLEKEIDNKKKEIDRMRLLIADELEHKTGELHESLITLQKSYSQKEEELNILSSKIITARQRIEQLESTFRSKREKIKGYQDSTALLNEQFPALEQQRRQLHNTLQDLKGKIRVFCRIRPRLQSESSLEQIGTYLEDTMNENGKQELLIAKDSDETQGSYGHTSNAANGHSFQFDNIFDEHTSNPEIFSEISQLIQSSLDGDNVCVFAYGQTGSGKTFTMAHEDDGMIPMSMRKIFEDIQNLESQGWKYEVEGVFVEIYNEQIIDLLSSSSSAQKHEIKHDEEAHLTTITNVTTVTMSNEEEAKRIFHKATRNRSTASTKANERSSRSHSVFIINIKGTNEELGKESRGTLNLIDLAGSERLNNSQARGERLRETQAINKSLSCLGDVIHSLARQQTQNGQSTHIPYRNSKLTYLLKNSLAGSSKTLMFVNISPLIKNYNETVNSLRFATKVNNTKMN